MTSKTVIHHLNCGTMHRKRPYVSRFSAATNCLLVETNHGLVLVDSGFGVQDYTRPTRFMDFFLTLVRSPRQIEETAVRQAARLGYQPGDVRHIVLTHMHLDHAGGLPDFPHAQVHLHRAEYKATMQPRGFKERFYCPAHWAHGPSWALHECSGQKWFDFDCISVIEDLFPQILLIPLIGHSRGHCGVAIEKESGWLLNCGDAASAVYPVSDPTIPEEKPLPKIVEWLIGPHVTRLRAFAKKHGEQVELICGHARLVASSDKL